MLIKSSILFFYCRIFVHNKRLKKLSWMIITWAGSYNLALILVMAFGCIPFSALWTYKEGRCINIVIPEGVLGSVISWFFMVLRIGLTRKHQDFKCVYRHPHPRDTNPPRLSSADESHAQDISHSCFPDWRCVCSVTSPSRLDIISSFYILTRVQHHCLQYFASCCDSDSQP